MACAPDPVIPMLDCCGGLPHRDFIGLNLVFEFTPNQQPFYTVGDLNGFLASMKAYLDAIPSLYDFVHPTFPLVVNILNGRSFNPTNIDLGIRGPAGGFGTLSVDGYVENRHGEAQIASSGIYLESDPTGPIRALQVCRVDIALADTKIICVREGSGDGNLYPATPTAGPTLIGCTSTQYGAGIISITTPGVILVESGNHSSNGFPLYTTPMAHGNHAWVSDQTGQDGCCNFIPPP